MTKYSFRAECERDVKELMSVCHQNGKEVHIIESKRDPNFPDILVEIFTFMSKKDIKGMIARVTDGHVMERTIQSCPISENSNIN